MRPAPRGSTTGTARVDPLERRHVEMVEVDVGDEHRVEPPESRPVDRLLAAEMGDPPPEDGIGDDPHAVERDDDRAVPEPGDAAQGIGARGSGAAVLDALARRHRPLDHERDARRRAERVHHPVEMMSGARGVAILEGCRAFALRRGG